MSEQTFTATEYALLGVSQLEIHKFTLDASGKVAIRTVAGVGASSFLLLTDTPSDYTGQAGMYTRVNGTEDGLEFGIPAGGGDVVGPASAVANNIPIFSGISGKIIKDSGFSILTSVPAGALFTDTTYNIGNGGLTEINFTSTLNSKLGGIGAGANLVDVIAGTNISIDKTDPQNPIIALNGALGSTTFLGLTDTPASFVGNGGLFVKVNVGETGLEYGAPAGAGDVVGPASSVADRIATFSGTSGKLIQDSGSLVSDLLDRANHTGTQLGDTIILSNLGGATYTTVQQMQDIYHSAGWASGGIITNNGDGTISVDLGEGYIKGVALATATLFACKWAASLNIAITNDANNYVYIEYNAGTPQVIVTTSKRTDFFTNILLAVIYKNGTTQLHINNTVKFTISDHAGAMIQRLQATMRFARESGATMSETGTRNLAVTGGKFWEGLNPFTTNAFDSSIADNFTCYYRDGIGGWNKILAATQVDNLLYDNGTGTLGTLGNNQYGVHWVYLEADSEINMIFGRGTYTLTEAQSVNPFSDNPPQLATQARLIGKIIIGKSSTTFEEIQSAFDTTFESSPINDHNSLINLQGGITAEYYHLSAAEYTIMQNTSGTNTGDQTSIVGITGTTAQFNTSLTDGSFATLAGNETLINKTIDFFDNAITGNLADFNAALSDGIFATGGGTATGTNTGDQDLSGYSLTSHNHTGVYEPVFTKNTAFNLNLGTSAGTVLEGNTVLGIVGTKTVDEAAIGDTKMLAYNSTSGNIEYIVAPTGGGSSANGVNGQSILIEGEIVDGIQWELTAFASNSFADIQFSTKTRTTATLTLEVFKNGVSAGTGTITSATTISGDRYFGTITTTTSFVDTDTITYKTTDTGTGSTSLIINNK